MGPGRRIRVLSVCDDEGIRRSREMVLKFEAYDVESVPSTEKLEPEQLRSFHIAVLCHSIPPSRAAELASCFRSANPDIRVVRVHAIRSHVDHVYDVDCEVFPGPGQLLSGIRTLAARIQSRPKPLQNARTGGLT